METEFLAQYCCLKVKCDKTFYKDRGLQPLQSKEQFFPSAQLNKSHLKLLMFQDLFKKKNLIIFDKYLLTN